MKTRRSKKRAILKSLKWGEDVPFMLSKIEGYNRKMVAFFMLYLSNNNISYLNTVGLKANIAYGAV